MDEHESFVQLVKENWSENLRLPGSEALYSMWQQLPKACSPGEPFAETKVTVLQWPTGTGKTQAVMQLASMLKADLHPGILMVTRFRSEADLLARRINQLAGSKTALAYHNDAKAGLHSLQSAPTLIVTHSAYQRALYTSLVERSPRSNWDALTSWDRGSRGITIIDEAIDLVASAEVDLNILRAVCTGVQDQFSGLAKVQLEAVSNFANLFAKGQGTSCDRRLTASEAELLSELQTKEFQEAVMRLPLRSFSLPKTRTDEQADFREIARDCFRALAECSKLDSPWTSRRGAAQKLHSSRLLLPSVSKTMLMLDATASLSSLYEAMPDRFTVMPKTPNVRRYENVTVHISRGHNVGKDTLTKNAVTEWRKVLIALEQRNPPVGRMLVACHKAVREKIAGTSTRLREVHYVNWGNIDGRNDWRDFDTIVIFGLPYLNAAPSTNLALACEAYNLDSLSGDVTGELQHSTIADIDRSQIERNDLRHIQASVVQCVNRGRCRQITDELGNCDRTEVYILLPNGKVGDGVVEAITGEMPGAEMREWSIQAALRKVRRRASDKIVSHLKTRAPGCYHKHEITIPLDISERSFERASAEFQKPPYQDALAAIGVTYHRGLGRGAEVYFQKQ